MSMSVMSRTASRNVVDRVAMDASLVSFLAAALGLFLSSQAMAAAPSATTAPATQVTDVLATLNGAATPNGDATTGWFRYSPSDPGACDDAFGTRAPAFGGTAVGIGANPVAYAITITGLFSQTTYYFCAIVQNASGSAFGAVLSFTTAGPPAVTTSAATALTPTSATLNGSANPNGLAAKGWFRYATTDPVTCNDSFGTRVPSSSAADAALGAGTSDVPFAQALAGLSTGTTYYFCALASNAAGKSFGSVLSFAASADTPVVTSDGATSITFNSAQLNGSANPGGANATGWFRYSTTSPGSCNDSFGTRTPAAGGAALGAGVTSVPYSQAASGLTGLSTYYFCAIAQNSVGTSFGGVLSFTTAADPPSVTTSAASSVTTTSATLNASANPNGDPASGWFRYSTTDPGICDDTFGTRLPSSSASDAALGSGLAPVAFSGGLVALTPGTIYFFCALAANSSGTAFGAVLSFTAAGSPAVSTGAATLVTPISATFNGSGNPNGSSTTAWFRYSSTSPGTCNDTFGVRVPVSGGPALGAGSSSVQYSMSAAGLQRATSYYYCAIAQNSIGTSFGAVIPFTTVDDTIFANDFE